MALDRKLKVMCGWCGAKNNLGNWSDLTYSKCTNREMKRAFTPLTERKAFLRKSDTFYICPSCGRWSRGCQLSIVDTKDKSLLSLGRENLFSFGESNDKLGKAESTNDNKNSILLREKSTEEKVEEVSKFLNGDIKLGSKSILEINDLI